MVSSAQKKAIRFFSGSLRKEKAQEMLEDLWRQRMHWWFAHVERREEQEAKHAFKAVEIRDRILRSSDLVPAQLSAWEREWDEQFEAWFRRMGAL